MQDIIDVKKPEQAKVGKVSKGSFSGKLLPWLLVFIVLAAGAAGTMYYKNRAEKIEADPSTAQKEKNQVETDRVITALKSALLVTETEVPTVARVEDPEKLKTSNETFYKDIQKGDYLIIFPKRAIVYRESIDQIINIAPIINTADLKADEGTTPASKTDSTKKP